MKLIDVRFFENRLNDLVEFLENLYLLEEMIELIEEELSDMNFLKFLEYLWDLGFGDFIMLIWLVKDYLLKFYFFKGWRVRKFFFNLL